MCRTRVNKVLHDSLRGENATWALLIAKILWEAISVVWKVFVLAHGVQDLCCY